MNNDLIRIRHERVQLANYLDPLASVLNFYPGLPVAPTYIHIPHPSNSFQMQISTKIFNFPIADFHTRAGGGGR